MTHQVVDIQDFPTHSGSKLTSYVTVDYLTHQGVDIQNFPTHQGVDIQDFPTHSGSKLTSYITVVRTCNSLNIFLKMLVLTIIPGGD
jgi:hypothetical protein